MKSSGSATSGIIAHNRPRQDRTLSDRLLERTGPSPRASYTTSMLDAMDLERERGITIKCHAVTLGYRARDGQDYILNLIDTPRARGLLYEVSRSLARARGRCSSSTPSQGVEAQTLATPTSRGETTRVIPS